MRNRMTSVFRKGEVIEFLGHEYLFEAPVNLKEILALDPRTGEKHVLQFAGVKSLEAKDAVKVKALETVTKERWEIAKHRFEAIKPLLSRDRGRQAYVKVAAKAAVDVATVYRWRCRFLKTGLLSSLLPNKPGVARGTKRLDDSVEGIIVDVIDNHWMKDPNMLFQAAYDMIKARCRSGGLEVPHLNTIRNRLAEHKELKRKRALELAPEQILARPGGSLVAEYPLEVIQIDHTKLDVFVVDEEFRLSLGRPWITVAIDVATRAILGYYISFDPPGAHSVGICLYQAIVRKEESLRVLGLTAPWPMWGVPTTVYADNAKEFRGDMLRMVCEEYGINLQWRPVRKPRWGGHIERLLLGFAQELKTLPGASFSNPEERGDYDSEGKAVLTLRELDRYLGSLICETYHVRVHRTIGKSPLAAWTEGTLGKRGIGMPRTVPNEVRLRLHLLPFEERAVSEYGVQIDNILYYHDTLRPYIGAVLPGRYRVRRKFVFRRDPRDISVIYFYDPEADDFFEIPYRDTSRPSISVWELRAAVRDLDENDEGRPTEDKLFEAVLRRRQLVADATKKTKKARRENELQRQRAGVRPVLPAKESKPQSAQSSDFAPSFQPKLYSGIRLS